MRAANFFQRFTKSQVVRAEIVAPLAEAVRLVHGEERDFDAVEGVEEALRAEALGSYVNELPLAGAHPVEPFLLLGPTERGVDHGRCDTAGDERVHLVFH